MGNEVKKLKCKLRKNSDRSKERGSTVDSADREKAKFNRSSPTTNDEGMFTSMTKNFFNVNQNSKIVISNYQLGFIKNES